MTPEESLHRGAGFLDEATENLTFDEFAWAFEEAWCGVAWSLNALSQAPRAQLEPCARGALPQAGSLIELLSALDSPPGEVRVVYRLEALRRELAQRAGSVEVGLSARAEAVVQLVFDAWALHDACGLRLGLVDERLGDGLMLEDASPGRHSSKVLHRRDVLKWMLVGGVAPLVACGQKPSSEPQAPAPGPAATQADAPGIIASKSPPATVKAVSPLRPQIWKTRDPFLFCAYHLDDYPQGNAEMGPAASLEGRELGRDFVGRDNWRMYHGRTVPGFPRHPHRGFETVTVVRSGMLDHSDSMGATARYGGGDVQWLTAGQGIQHAEMFPLLKQDAPNPLELFQIWLNLPAVDKMVDPHFTMLWRETIPRVVETDAQGRVTQLTLCAGRYKDHAPPSPPPNSWASRAEADVAIWTLRMEPGAGFTLPPVSDGTWRTLYVHAGAGMKVAGRSVAANHRVEVDEPGALQLEAGASETEVLLLQGRPIGEPVAKRGPFVMNTQQEIRQAYADYRRTQFGGWPWGDNGPAHERVKGRFARHIDGAFEEPT